MSEQTFSLATVLSFLSGPGVERLLGNAEAKPFSIRDTDAEDHLDFLEAATGVCLINQVPHGCVSSFVFNQALYNYLCTEDCSADFGFNKEKLPSVGTSRIAGAILGAYPLFKTIHALYSVYELDLLGSIREGVETVTRVNYINEIQCAAELTGEHHDLKHGWSRVTKQLLEDAYENRFTAPPYALCDTIHTPPQSIPLKETQLSLAQRLSLARLGTTP